MKTQKEIYESMNTKDLCSTIAVERFMKLQRQEAIKRCKKSLEWERYYEKEEQYDRAYIFHGKVELDREFYSITNEELR